MKVICIFACVVLGINGCLLHVNKKLIDLTHAFDENTIYWPTEEDFKHEKEFYGQTDKGYFYSSYRISAAEHGGTHTDAPIHFNKNGQTLDEIPLWRLVGPAVVVDVAKLCKENRDYLISIQDFLDWEKKNKQQLDNKIILLKTDYARYWPNRLLYMGTNERGPDAIKKMHFPGLAPEAARWLVEQRHIRAVGIDTPSIDYGQTTQYGSHRALFEYNVPAFENLADLNQLPSFGFEIVALPMKIKNGSGGPLRIVAFISDK
jgi:kynurenine formamidase